MQDDAPIQGARSRSVSAALFSAATGVSRVLGLAREVISAQLLGVSGPASAFVVANNVPNTVRSLVADSALGASFVPVFNELLVKGERERAWRVASSALTLATLALMGVTALGILFARPLLSFANLSGEQLDLAVQMTRILFPILILLGISGLVQAILNSFDEFVLPAIAPVFWNVVIIGFLLYAFTVDSLEERAVVLAVGTLTGTVIQTLIPLPGLRGKGGTLRPLIDLADPAVRRILILLIPVALGLGLANINLTVSTFIATYVDPAYAPRRLARQPWRPDQHSPLARGCRHRRRRGLGSLDAAARLAWRSTVCPADLRGRVDQRCRRALSRRHVPLARP